MSDRVIETTAAVAETSEQLQTAIHALKAERDTWRAVAESYQAAFLSQTSRLHELQNICVATQAELENERTMNRRNQAGSGASQTSLRGGGLQNSIEAHDSLDNASFGTAIIHEPVCATSFRFNPCFGRVEQLASQHDYGTALKEVDYLLRGSLTPKARVEGLLLKGSIMRKSERLYDALATCSEALELCHRLDGLQHYLPRIQYQRGLCYYHLQMIKQAREAFSEVYADDNLMYANAFELRNLCDDQLQGRRSGFEAHRTVTEGLLSQLYEDRADVSDARKLVFRVLTSAVKETSCKSTLPTSRIKGEAAFFAPGMDFPKDSVARDELMGRCGHARIICKCGRRVHVLLIWNLDVRRWAIPLFW